MASVPARASLMSLPSASRRLDCSLEEIRRLIAAGYLRETGPTYRRAVRAADVEWVRTLLQTGGGALPPGA